MCHPFPPASSFLKKKVKITVYHTVQIRFLNFGGRICMQTLSRFLPFNRPELTRCSNSTVSLFEILWTRGETMNQWSDVCVQLALPELKVHPVDTSMQPWWADKNIYIYLDSHYKISRVYKANVILYLSSLYHLVDGLIFNGGHLTKLAYTSSWRSSR